MLTFVVLLLGCFTHSQVNGMGHGPCMDKPHTFNFRGQSMGCPMIGQDKQAMCCREFGAGNPIPNICCKTCENFPGACEEDSAFVYFGKGKNGENLYCDTYFPTLQFSAHKCKFCADHGHLCKRTCREFHAQTNCDELCEDLPFNIPGGQTTDCTSFTQNLHPCKCNEIEGLSTKCCETCTKLTQGVDCSCYDEKTFKYGAYYTSCPELFGKFPLDINHCMNCMRAEIAGVCCDSCKKIKAHAEAANVDCSCYDSISTHTPRTIGSHSFTSCQEALDFYKTTMNYDLCGIAQVQQVCCRSCNPKEVPTPPVATPPPQTPAAPAPEETVAPPAEPQTPPPAEATPSPPVEQPTTAPEECKDAITKEFPHTFTMYEADGITVNKKYVFNSCKELLDEFPNSCEDDMPKERCCETCGGEGEVGEVDKGKDKKDKDKKSPKPGKTPKPPKPPKTPKPPKPSKAPKTPKPPKQKKPKKVKPPKTPKPPKPPKEKKEKGGRKKGKKDDDGMAPKDNGDDNGGKPEEMEPKDKGEKEDKTQKGKQNKENNKPEKPPKEKRPKGEKPPKKKKEPKGDSDKKHGGGVVMIV